MFILFTKNKSLDLPVELNYQNGLKEVTLLQFDLLILNGLIRRIDLVSACAHICSENNNPRGSIYILALLTP